MRAVIVVALLALLSIQCSEALRLRRRTRPGVPQDELNAAAAYFAADNYNPRVTSIPGWTHTLSYRFAMGSESQGQAGHADGFASDKYDFVIAFRGAVEEADEWSQKADSIDYDVIANPLDPEATSDSQVHERLYRSAQKYLSAKNTLDGKFINQDFIDSMEKICLKGYKVTLTGHSQGGAVAAFVAWELRSKFSTCDLTLITFGAPPVMTETATQAFLKLTPAIDVRNYVTQCFDNGATVADPISQRFQRFHPLGTIRYLDGKDDRMEFPDQDKPKLAYPVAVLCHYPDNYFDALQDLLHLETDYWIRWCPRRRPRPIQGFQIVKEWSEVRQHHKRLMVSEQPENEGAAGRPKTLEDTFRANPCEHTPTFRLNTDYTPGARLPFPEPPKKVLAPGTA